MRPSLRCSLFIKFLSMLSVLRYDSVAVVGPNGIGKSTFLNLLLGKVDPVSLYKF